MSTYRSIILHTVHRPVRPYFITILCKNAGKFKGFTYYLLALLHNCVLDEI